METLKPNPSQANTFKKVYRNSPKSVECLLDSLPLDHDEKSTLWDPYTSQNFEQYSSYIENMVGTVKIPLGIAGPIRVIGEHANGSYIVPMATSEGALLASYHRGMMLINAAGGCKTALLSDTMTRSPVFVFKDLPDAMAASRWIQDQFSMLQQIVEGQSQFARLQRIDYIPQGNILFLLLSFSTGDAAGQNMVTFGSSEICKYILKNSPFKIVQHYIEANLCGDKKATNFSFQRGRGKRVTAEVSIPRELFEETFKVTIDQVNSYFNCSTVGSLLSGSIGGQAHVANAIAAIYLACGQDVACVAESSVGVFNVLENSDEMIHFSLTLPNIIVGTVGGGTSMPSASAALNIMGMLGAGKAKAFAEIITATALAGEISLFSAIAGDHFIAAHQALGRRKKRSTNID